MTLNGIRYVAVGMQCIRWMRVHVHRNEREREKEHRMIRCIHITIKWHRRLIVFQYSLVTQLMENFPHKLLHYFTVSGFPLHTLWRSVYLSLLFKCIKLMTLQRKITTYFRYALSLPLHSDLDCCCCCCVCVCFWLFAPTIINYMLSIVI